MTTKERLAQRLESLGAHDLAERTRQGLYSDFESAVAMPKVLIVTDLKLLASRNVSEATWRSLHTMVQEVYDGKWDHTPEEAEAWAAAQTGEIREMIDRLSEHEVPVAQAEQWNKTVNIGDEVEYLSYPGADPQRFKTSSEAWVLEGHTAVLFLEGKSGCVAVGACRLVSS